MLDKFRGFYNDLYLNGMPSLGFSLLHLDFKLIPISILFIDLPTYTDLIKKLI